MSQKLHKSTESTPVLHPDEIQSVFSYLNIWEFWVCWGWWKSHPRGHHRTAVSGILHVYTRNKVKCNENLTGIFVKIKGPFLKCANFIIEALLAAFNMQSCLRKFIVVEFCWNQALQWTSCVSAFKNILQGTCMCRTAVSLNLWTSVNKKVKI